ncbi:hypothetical protein PMIN03_003789 [Paraphaeosphaeria minitans]
MPVRMPVFVCTVDPIATGGLEGKCESFMKPNAVPLDLSLLSKGCDCATELMGQDAGPSGVAFERRHTEGGHFAGHEGPELLVADARALVQSVSISPLASDGLPTYVLT